MKHLISVLVIALAALAAACSSSSGSSAVDGGRDATRTDAAKGSGSGSSGKRDAAADAKSKGSGSKSESSAESSKGSGSGRGSDAGRLDAGPPVDAGTDAADSAPPGRGDAGPCTLDKTFGDGGTLFAGIRDGGTPFSPVLFLSDAVIAVANGQPGVNAASVTRYKLDGSSDPTFNGGVPVALNFGTAAYEFLVGALQQSDGKIVVYGYSFSGGLGRDLVARVSSDGSIDTAFGTNGMVVNLPPYQDQAFGAARLFAATQQPNKDLLFGGSNATGAGTWFLMQLASTGALDPTMGDGGFADQTPTTTGFPTGAVLQSNQQILLFGEFYDTVSGQYVGRWGIERYSSGGVLDTTYGTHGVVKVDVGAGLGGSGIEVGHIDTTDRLTVASGGATDAGAFFAAARFDQGGQLDFAFNSAKLQMIPLGSGTSDVSSLLVDATERFILVGSSPLNEAAVVRLNVDGSLDTTCGNHGVATAPTTGLSGYPPVVATLDAQGRLLIAGQGANGTATGIWFARLWM